MFVTRGSKNSLILSLILFPTWIVVKDINFGSTKVIQWVPRQHKVLNHRQERFFLKVNSVSIHSFVEWLDTFSYVLRPADVTIKEVNHIRYFAIDIAKDLMLLSCRHTMERLCALQFETSFATLVTTLLTLADRRWRSRYRSPDQCILNAYRSSERYNGWLREQLGQRFTFFNFFPMMTDDAWNFL
jgi:hypothetical protein